MKQFWMRKKPEEPRNPEGMTYEEFLDKHKNIPHIARICWYFGIQPDELRNELKTLLEGEI